MRQTADAAGGDHQRRGEQYRLIRRASPARPSAMQRGSDVAVIARKASGLGLNACSPRGEIVVADDHVGLRTALREALAEAAYQRCYVLYCRHFDAMFRAGARL